jgi:hypothetical protein
VNSKRTKERKRKKHKYGKEEEGIKSGGVSNCKVERADNDDSIKV